MNEKGFRLNQNKTYVLGPMVIFHSAVLQWNVRDVFDINEQTLSIFTLLEPKPEVVVIGFGDQLGTISSPRRARLPDGEEELEDEEEEERRYAAMAHEKKYNEKVNAHIARMTLLMRDKGHNLTFLPTENAAGVYNFLVEGKALLPFG